MIINKNKLYWIFVLLAVYTAACTGMRKEKPAVVAQVYDYYLSHDELLRETPAGLTPNDSVIYVTNYINNWISQKLLLHHAESNLSELKKDFSRQMEEYRQSLLIYAYERELVLQKLDTIVTEEQIESFYAGNREMFVLKDNIVKVLYMKIPLNAPNIRLIRNYIRNASSDDILKLEDYGARYAANYYLDDETWLFFNDLLKEIPIRSYDHDSYLRNNRYIEMQDTLYHYFVNIKQFMIKESTSPIDFEKERIAEMIVNRRKMDLLNRLKEDIYREAVEHGKIVVY